MRIPALSCVSDIKEDLHQIFMAVSPRGFTTADNRWLLFYTDQMENKTKWIPCKGRAAPDWVKLETAVIIYTALLYVERKRNFKQRNDAFLSSSHCNQHHQQHVKHGYTTMLRSRWTSLLSQLCRQITFGRYVTISSEEPRHNWRVDAVLSATAQWIMNVHCITHPKQWKSWRH